MLFANTHKFIHEARRLHPVIYDLQITYHKDQDTPQNDFIWA